MKIVILGEFTNLNEYIDAERTHRQIAAKIKKRNTEVAHWQLKRLEPFDKFPCRIKFTWYTKDKRVDPDGVAFEKKFILDAMVIQGIIPNDSRRYIKGFTDDFEVDKQNPRVEIIVEDAGK